MKKVRFILALVLALAMVLGAPLSAFAEVHDNVTTGEEVANIFYTDTDEEVVINLGSDVQIQGGLTANEGQSYTINGNGSTIADVVFTGVGSVVVNADVVTDEWDTALGAYEGVEVTVNGNVDGLSAGDDAVVSVNGDVNGLDVSEDNANADYGIYASGNAEVTVDGNVTGGSGYLEDLTVPYSDGETAVYAEDNAAVTVTGDVTGGDAMGTYGYAGDGVWAEGESTVTVGGDVTGGSVTADPEIEGDISIAGSAVSIGSDATVTVGGNATGGSTNGYAGMGGNGVEVDGETGGEDSPAPDATGSVTVNGTVSGGNGGEDGVSGTAIVYEYRSGFEDLEKKALELAQTPVEDLTEEEMYALFDYAMYAMYSMAGMTDEEFEALAEEYFGGEIPEEVPMEDSAAFVQYIINEAVPEALKESNILDEYDFPTVTAWEVAEADGFHANSVYGYMAAEMYSAENTVYSIKVTQPKGGTITVDKETALEGETITITVAVEDGYTLKSVSCGAGEPTDNGDGTYSFVVPAGGGVEVSAVIDAPPAATPATGDSFNMALTTALAVVSLLGICALTVTRKKTV